MQRLTPLSRILIILAILALLFFGAKYLMGDKFPLGNKSGNAVKTEKSDVQKEVDKALKKTEQDLSKGKTKSNTSAKGAFTYRAKEPIGGKLMGVVELGAAGFNSFIIRKDADDNWMEEKYEWGNSMVVDGLATGADVTTNLKRYIANILDYGVSGKNVHFVVSSGAQKEAKVKPIIAALKNMGYVVNLVTPEQEGQYALRSVLPADYADKAFVVDIGSGNTKVSWVDGSRVVAHEAVGAKYYTKDISDSQARDDAYTVGQKVPARLAGTCFIIGGVPYNLAKAVRNGDERYTVLGDPSSYAQLAEEKGKKVASGLNIYQAISDGSGCERFIFDWDANFTIGFLLSLPG